MTSQVVLPGPLALAALVAGGALIAHSAALEHAAEACPQTDTGITVPNGILRDRIRRQRRARTADGRGAGRHRLCEYVERRLLQQRYAAGRRLPRRAQGYEGSRQGGPGCALRQTAAEGGHGGTGIALYKDGLYAEINDRIVRYALKDGVLAPTEKPVTVLSGMPITGDHPMHPFAIDAEGNLFVSMGSATNTCEVKNRMPHSPGNDPCTELETRAGTSRYDANKTDQVFSPKERYASGIRNGEGFDFDAAGRLFVTQHGRDQLHENWPELYTVDQGFELFTYWKARDPRLEGMRDAPEATLTTLWPKLQSILGGFAAENVRIRPIDLYVTEGYLQPGIVLVGDAFATACPAGRSGGEQGLDRRRAPLQRAHPALARLAGHGHGEACGLLRRPDQACVRCELHRPRVPPALTFYR